jgi:3-hydroxybutyryl-CoA dehydrogenase
MEKVGVIGCGLMGSGIAEISARAGCEVVVVEANSAAIDAGRERIEKSLQRALKAQKISVEDAASLEGRLNFSTDFDALHDRTMVIEAVAENEPIKLDVFATLDRVVTSDEAVFATNTSSLPIIKLAMATTRPQNVVGLHFFNPVPVLKLVEVTPSLLTSDSTLEKARKFATDELNKEAIVAPDRAGFVVNALLVPFLLSAIRMYESGIATAKDIDSGMVLGCAHPIGPLALSDLIGLDTLVSVADTLYAEFKESHMAPPPLLLRMSQAGLNGRKSGRGFYEYS